MFHKHNWVKIKETYAPPYNWKWGEITSYWLHSYEKSQMGVTTILWECSICHDTKKEEMLGKETR
jgi:hypothetical protein